VPPAPAEFSSTSQRRSCVSSSSSRKAGTTRARPSSNPAPRWEPTWKTTPSASIAAAVSSEARIAATDFACISESGLARFTRYSAWQSTASIPASCRRARNRSVSSSACDVGFHMRGLCVKICAAWHRSSSARSIALEIPPADETWAP
jgi:hypothetical protein